MGESERGMKAGYEEWLRGNNHEYDATEEGGERLLWDLWVAACKWQLAHDVQICNEVSEMMAARPLADYAEGGKVAASHCANFIALRRVVKD